MARRIIPGAAYICVYILCTRNLCTCMYSLRMLLPDLSSTPTGTRPSGRSRRALRRALPRRARRLDGRRRAAVDRGRPRPHDLAAAVGRLRLRARLRRPAAARRPRRRPARPPARAARRRSRVFTVASALGGLVNDGTLLVATRFLKGAAAAFTAPAGLSIITTTFAEGPARNRALSIYTASARAASRSGSSLGGLLTELGWRWTFLLPVPIALALLAVAPRVHPARPRRARAAARRFDIPGAVTLTAGDAAARAHGRRGARRGLGARPTTIGALRAARRAAVGVRGDRAPLAPQPLVRLGHPALGPARAGEPRRWRRCSAPTSASSSSGRCTCRPLQRLVGAQTALAFLPGRRCSSPSARRGSGRWSTASARRASIAARRAVVRRRLRARSCGIDAAPVLRRACCCRRCCCSASASRSASRR